MTLMHLVDKEWLGESWKKLRKGAAYGIDAVSASKYEEDLEANLDRLLYRTKVGHYQSQPVKRIYIARRDGKKRALGLPTVEDKIAQKKVSWVLEVNIASFFDNIQHEWLMKFISHRIKDQRVLKHIKGWLEVGIMEDGKLIASSSGSPQGGVISPTLANIYLHYVIDLWATKVASKSINGEM